jgi:N-acetylated-alpha-linked acidic dipeptidase
MYKLAADPTATSGTPTPPSLVPALDFAALDTAIDRLKHSAADYDAAVAAKGAGLKPADKTKLFELQRSLDQTLLNDTGLPFRPWFRNLIYAPGRFTGYGAKTLPGVREAIEEDRWADVAKYATLTAQALDAYSARLDEATKLLNGG